MTLQGTAVYVPEKEALVWKIKSFPGGREFLLRAKFSLPSVAAEEEPRGRMPPMRVNFEIPYFTVSGIQVLCRRCTASLSCPALSVHIYCTSFMHLQGSMPCPINNVMLASLKRGILAKVLMSLSSCAVGLSVPGCCLRPCLLQIKAIQVAWCR